MAVLRCPNCRTPLASGQYFCHACGQGAPADIAATATARPVTSPCRRCDAPLEPGQIVCHACGTLAVSATARVPVGTTPGWCVPAAPPDQPPPRAKVVMQWGGWVKDIELPGYAIRIGRAEDNDVVIPAPFLAPHHVEIAPAGSTYVIRDTSPGQGLLAHGRFVSDVMLRTGYSVRIGDGESNLIQLTYFVIEPEALEGRAETREERPRPIATPGTIGLVGTLPSGATEAFIGRDPNGTFVLDHPMVGHRHAVLKYVRGAWMVQDLRSRDGTYLNGKRISHGPLQDGDILQIGPFSALYRAGGFEAVDARTSDALRIDVIDADYTTAKGKQLLSRVSLSILPGEFVALVGGSGAGKSTLMRLLGGLYTPGEGVVLYNGLDLRAYRAAFARAVGYVPQDDIVHLDLSVEDALTYAARLRLPADLSDAHIRQRVADVLDAVDLTPQHGQLVNTLSGGQRKRVSIAVELLPQPRLLFLDEPTSGLDPGLDKRMMFLLRRLTDRGHTVVLVTHTPAHLDLCDNVVFMGVGGHVTYYGPPHLITRFFGQQDLADVFSAIDSPDAAQHWAERYHDSDVFTEHVRDRQRGIPAPAQMVQPVALSPSARNAEIIRQCAILVRRQFALLANDRGTLALLLLQAPVSAILIALVAGSDPFRLRLVQTAQGAQLSGISGQRLVFSMAFAVILLGTLNSVRDLVKERPIAVRERMVGVLPPAYLASKVAALSVLGLIQTLILLLFVGIVHGLPPSGLIFPPFFEMEISLVLGVLAGTGLGLAVSAASPSSDRAMSVAPFLILAQVLFAGVVFPLGGAEILSYICPSRWATGALGDTAQLFQDHALGHGWIGLYSGSGGALFGQWLALLGLIAGGLALTYFLQDRHRQV